MTGEVHRESAGKENPPVTRTPTRSSAIEFLQRASEGRESSPLAILSDSAARSPLLRSHEGKEKDGVPRSCSTALIKQLVTPHGPSGKGRFSQLSVDTAGSMSSGIKALSASSAGGSTVPGSGVSGSSSARRHMNAITSKPTTNRKGVKSDTKYRGAWTHEEDERLIEIVKARGASGWTAIANELDTGRNGRQCRERWSNQINPDLKRTGWTDEEDELILKIHKEVGNKWATIAKHLPGRTDNMVKNRFNGSLLPKTQRPEGQGPRKVTCTGKKKPGQSRGSRSTAAASRNGQGTAAEQEDMLVGSAGKKRRRESKDSSIVGSSSGGGGSGSGSGGSSSGKRKSKKKLKATAAASATAAPPSSILTGTYKNSSDSAAVAGLSTASNGSLSADLFASATNSSTPILDRLTGLHTVASVLDFSSPAITSSPIKRNFVPLSASSTAGSTAGLRGLPGSAFSEIISGRSSAQSLLGSLRDPSPGADKKPVSSPYLQMGFTPNRFAEMLGADVLTPAAMRELSFNSSAMAQHSSSSTTSPSKKRQRASEDTVTAIDKAPLGSQTPNSLTGASRLTDKLLMLTRSALRRYHRDKPRPESPIDEAADVEAANKVLTEKASSSSSSSNNNNLKSQELNTNSNNGSESDNSNAPQSRLIATPAKSFSNQSFANSPSIAHIIQHLQEHLNSAKKANAANTTPRPARQQEQDLKLDSNRQLQALVAEPSSNAVDPLGACSLSKSGFEESTSGQLVTDQECGMSVLSEVATSNLLAKDVVGDSNANSLLSVPEGHSLLSAPGALTGKLLSPCAQTQDAIKTPMREDAKAAAEAQGKGSTRTNRSAANDSLTDAASSSTQTPPSNTKKRDPGAASKQDFNATLSSSSKRTLGKQTTTPNGVTMTPQQQGTRQTTAQLSWKTSKTPCRCKKTRCLRRYCDCFSNALHCGPSCECLDCSNSSGNELWKVAVVSHPSPVDGSPRDAGCKCKNTHCLKRYCDCFRQGKACGPRCNCESCQNLPGLKQEKGPHSVAHSSGLAADINASSPA